MPPGLERVVAQDAPHGLGGDPLHQPFGDQGPRDLGAIPLTERATLVIRPLAGDLDHVQRHLGDAVGKVMG